MLVLVPMLVLVLMLVLVPMLVLVVVLLQATEQACHRDEVLQGSPEV
jgi:hypothetical protein